ncbi:MAG TPA: hypothetical protein VMR23_10645 [Candidatus Limnocylindria bacterium]|nr:hypothetical protein [Candidatus Limnocylindria bacterium]
MPVIEERFEVAAVPEVVWAEGRGEDARLGSQVDVRHTLEPAPAGAGATTMSDRSEVKVLGRLGSVRDAVMKVKARALASQFAERVRAAIERAA